MLPRFQYEQMVSFNAFISLHVIWIDSQSWFITVMSRCRNRWTHCRSWRSLNPEKTSSVLEFCNQSTVWGCDALSIGWLNEWCWDQYRPPSQLIIHRTHRHFLCATFCVPCNGSARHQYIWETPDLLQSEARRSAPSETRPLQFHSFVYYNANFIIIAWWTLGGCGC